MNLSPNFTFEEMIASPTATDNGYTEQFIPPAIVIANAVLLAENILQPLRNYLNKPIVISSWYRCMRTNAKVGGVVNSQHLEGLAADTNVNGYTVEELYQLIRSTNLPFDQLIQEFNRWVHISFSATGSGRQQCIRYTDKGNYYDNTPRTITRKIV